MAVKKPSRSSQAFCEAFLKLVQVKPISEITVTEIADTAGYSRGAFYSQYVSLDDFLQSIVDAEAKEYVEMSARIRTNSEEGRVTYPQNSLLRMFEYVYSKKELYSFIFRNYSDFNTVEYFFAKTIKSSPKYILEFQEDDLPDIDPDFYTFLSSYVQKAAILFWIEQGFEWSPKHMAEQCSLFYSKDLVTAYSNKYADKRKH